jgi:hypothetical protein
MLSSFGDLSQISGFIDTPVSSSRKDQPVIGTDFIGNLISNYDSDLSHDNVL